MGWGNGWAGLSLQDLEHEIEVRQRRLAVLARELDLRQVGAPRQQHRQCGVGSHRLWRRCGGGSTGVCHRLRRPQVGRASSPGRDDRRGYHRDAPFRSGEHRPCIAGGRTQLHGDLVGFARHGRQAAVVAVTQGVDLAGGDHLVVHDQHDVEAGEPSGHQEVAIDLEIEGRYIGGDWHRGRRVDDADGCRSVDNREAAIHRGEHGRFGSVEGSQARGDGVGSRRQVHHRGELAFLHELGRYRRRAIHRNHDLGRTQVTIERVVGVVAIDGHMRGAQALQALARNRGQIGPWPNQRQRPASLGNEDVEGGRGQRCDRRVHRGPQHDVDRRPAFTQAQKGPESLLGGVDLGQLRCRAAAGVHEDLERHPRWQGVASVQGERDRRGLIVQGEHGPVGRVVNRHRRRNRVHLHLALHDADGAAGRGVGLAAELEPQVVAAQTQVDRAFEGAACTHGQWRKRRVAVGRQHRVGRGVLQGAAAADGKCQRSIAGHCKRSSVGGRMLDDQHRLALLQEPHDVHEIRRRTQHRLARVAEATVQASEQRREVGHLLQEAVGRGCSRLRCEPGSFHHGQCDAGVAIAHQQGRGHGRHMLGAGNDRVRCGGGDLRVLGQASQHLLPSDLRDPVRRVHTGGQQRMLLPVVVRELEGSFQRRKFALQPVTVTDAAEPRSRFRRELECDLVLAQLEVRVVAEERHHVGPGTCVDGHAALFDAGSQHGRATARLDALLQSCCVGSSAVRLGLAGDGCRCAGGFHDALPIVRLQVRQAGERAVLRDAAKPHGSIQRLDRRLVIAGQFGES